MSSVEFVISDTRQLPAPEFVIGFGRVPDELRSLEWIDEATDQAELRSLYHAIQMTSARLRQRLTVIGAESFTTPPPTTVVEISAGPSNLASGSVAPRSQAPSPSPRRAILTRVPSRSTHRDEREIEEALVLLHHAPATPMTPPAVGLARPITPPYTTRKGRTVKAPKRLGDEVVVSFSQSPRRPRPGTGAVRKMKTPALKKMKRSPAPSPPPSETGDRKRKVPVGEEEADVEAASVKQEPEEIDSSPEPPAKRRKTDKNVEKVPSLSGELQTLV